MKEFENSFSSGINANSADITASHSNKKDRMSIPPLPAHFFTSTDTRRTNIELRHNQRNAENNLKKYIGEHNQEVSSRSESFLSALGDDQDENLKKYESLVDFLAEKVKLLENENLTSDQNEIKGFDYRIEGAYKELQRVLYGKGEKMIRGKDALERTEDLVSHITKRLPGEDLDTIKKAFFEEEKNKETSRAPEKERLIVFFARLLEEQTLITPEMTGKIGRNSFNICLNHFSKLVGELGTNVINKENVVKIDHILLAAFDRKFSGDESRFDLHASSVKENLITFFSNYPNQSVPNLLDKIKTTKNKLLKKNYTEVVYRLEFGKIGISPDGVKYLQKTYDLQEFNNSDYFVNRLTAKGDIGIFDENKVLQKYFNIGDLSSEDATVKTIVLDFAYETLFMPKSGETPEECEERERYLQEFKENYFGFYNEEFHQKTGVRFNNLDFKEQGWFMLYHKHSDPEKQEKLMQFIATHGENGLRTFLSLEHGGQEMGEKILIIAQRLDDMPEIVNQLFSQYVHMIDDAEKSASEAIGIYDELFHEKIDLNEAVNFIMKKSADILKRAAFALSANEGTNREKIIQELLKDLERNAWNDANIMELLKSSAEKIKQSPDWRSAHLGESMYIASDALLQEKATSAEIEKYQHYENLFTTVTPENTPGLKGIAKRTKLTFAENPKNRHIKLLAMERSIKNIFKKFIYDKSDVPLSESFVGDRVIKKFQERIDQAKKSKQEMSEMVKNNLDLDDEQINKISDNLIEKAGALLSDYTDRISSGESVDEAEMMASLDRINARVELTKEIIGQLPRESVAQLDLSQLSDIERHVDLKAEDLMKIPELMEKMEKIVENNFTEADREAFSQYCLSSENNGLTVTTANGEVLSFFMKKRLSENLSYLNWFSTNPDAPIKGLGEATVLLGFNHSQKEQESFYAVAKPHVKSYGTLIEKLGFVGFGKEEVDEYDGNHYARTRKIPSDAQYSSKNFSPEQNVNFADQIKNICLENNKTYTLQFENREYAVCKVFYNGLTHKDDVTREDEDGWLYREIEKQSGKHQILTRYIPASSDKKNAAYYAVFEKDSSTQEERKELDYYLISSNLSRSDSKKSVNN